MRLVQTESPAEVYSILDEIVDTMAYA